MEFSQKPRHIVSHGRKETHLFASVSSRFKSTLLTTVHAASSSTFTPAGGGPSGLLTITVAFAGSFVNSAFACSNNSVSRFTSTSVGGRVKQRRKAYVTRCSVVWPPSTIVFRANA